MDVETAQAVSSGTRFERFVAVLIGVTALTAALLGTLQNDAGRKEERALVMAARLSVEVFERSMAGGLFFSFQNLTVREAAALLIEAQARGNAAPTQPSVRAAFDALAGAYLSSEDRLFAVAEAMGAPPTIRSGVHPHTVSAATASLPEVAGAAQEQNRQVELADRFGTKGNRAVLGLSLVAVAAVLVAVAAVVGRSAAGWVAAGTAAVVLAGSIGWGVAALVT
jgi:hypothetical protein